MITSPQLRAQLIGEDAEVVELSLTATGTTLEALIAATQAGVAQFYERWAADDPRQPDGSDLPPPEIDLIPAPPRLQMTLTKLTDLAVSFDRLVAALEAHVPARARLGVPAPVKAPRIVAGAVAQLVTRVAVTAEKHRSGPMAGWWVPDRDRVDRVDAAVLSWLHDVGPGRRAYTYSSRGQLTPIDADTIDAAWRAGHQGMTTLLVTVSGSRFRAVKDWRPTAHVCFGTGTFTPAAFDPAAALGELTGLLRGLEPDLQCAIIARTNTVDDLLTLNTVGFTLGTPDWDYVYHQRNTLNFNHERLYEDDGGIVDALGVVLVADPPADIDPAWTREPVGHLSMLTAPDVATAWFDTTVDPTARARARTALAALIRGRTEAGRFYAT